MTTFIPEASSSVTTGVIARIYDGESIVDLISELESSIPERSRASHVDSQSAQADLISRAAAGRLPELKALIDVLGRFGCALAVVPARDGQPGGYGRPWAEFS